MTTTLEEANESLRHAVRTRLDATPKDDPKMAGYKAEAVTKPRQLGASAEEMSQDDHGVDWDKLADGPYIEHLLQRLAGDGLLKEDRAPGSREWLDALDRLRALHHEKTAQYGGADDAFENVTASAKCGVEPWRRALCDLSDCVVRMQKYAQGQPVDPTNALLDAANWALICLIKMEEAGR
jgi:hypothetical protein